ncbi:MAG TPA: cob(I)yrinic acid a,c-diamide adenosyltransferase [Candidatus Acidoferrum sp.]|nr:cob(I)yrinic acid a,c-diamide adenosyltransferase [Candidatus Acidoferrum sp.]
MSISTRTGDDGTTGLMYNRRVPKTHPRIEACGAVDELNAALGMARSLARDPWLNGEIFTTQKELVLIMGELATELPDFDRYVKDGFDLFQPQMTARLDGIVKDLEAQKISFQGWATPGATPLAATLDLARTACRRAERGVCALRDANGLRNDDAIIYLNRLSDALWLLARWAETRSDTTSRPDKD